jgi:F-type H+-transporting ATPase subunit epsilon
MVPLPSTLALEIVTPEGLLLRDEVEEVIAPGEEGYFGVRPGHTGERAEDIDVGRAELALKRAAERMRAIRDEAGYEEAHLTYVRAVTRLAVARRERGGV